MGMGYIQNDEIFYESITNYRFTRPDNSQNRDRSHTFMDGGPSTQRSNDDYYSWLVNVVVSFLASN